MFKTAAGVPFIYEVRIKYSNRAAKELNPVLPFSGSTVLRPALDPEWVFNDKLHKWAAVRMSILGHQKINRRGRVTSF
jgi:hypothetical protein